MDKVNKDEVRQLEKKKRKTIKTRIKQEKQNKELHISIQKR